MFKNYLVVAFRNFSNNRIFSVINILGLSIGISASLVIFLIVHYSYSFDRFEKNPDRIFRVVSDFAFRVNPAIPAVYRHLLLMPSVRISAASTTS